MEGVEFKEDINPELQDLTNKYLHYLISQGDLNQELSGFINDIKSKNVILDRNTVYTFIEDYQNDPSNIQLLIDRINDTNQNWDDRTSTIRSILEQMHFDLRPVNRTLFKKEVGEDDMYSVENEDEDEDIKGNGDVNISKNMFYDFLLQTKSQNSDFKAIVSICNFMMSNCKNNYYTYDIRNIGFLQSILLNFDQDGKNVLYRILIHTLSEEQQNFIEMIYNWTVYYLSKYLFNALLIVLIEENQPLILDRIESSINDFKHILLICQFMVFPENYKYNDYLHDINQNIRLDIYFLSRILEYHSDDLNELYFILKMYLPKGIDIALMYQNFTDTLLRYFNMQNIMLAFDPPPLLLEIEPPLNEELVARDIKYQTQHYWDFLNDLIKNKLYSYCVKFEEGPEDDGPKPSDRIPVGPVGPLGPVAKGLERYDPIKNEALKYIAKATRERKYQFLYHLLSIYINTYGSELEYPKEILREIQIESENGINVDYILFYEAYTIFSLVMPKKIDNLQNYISVFSRRKLKSDKRTPPENEMNKVIFVLDIICKNRIIPDSDGVTGIQRIKKVIKTTQDLNNKNQIEINKNLEEINSEILVLRAPIPTITSRLIDPSISFVTPAKEFLRSNSVRSVGSVESVGSNLSIIGAPGLQFTTKTGKRKKEDYKPPSDSEYKSSSDSESEPELKNEGPNRLSMLTRANLSNLPIKPAQKAEEISKIMENRQTVVEELKEKAQENKKTKLNQKQQLREARIRGLKESQDIMQANRKAAVMAELEKADLKRSFSDRDREIQAEGRFQGLLENKVYQESSNVPNLKRSKGGQKGGNCNIFDPSKRLMAHRGKYAVEAPHDLDSSRGKKAIFEGQTIFAAKILGGGTENLYSLVESVLNDIVGEMNPADPPVSYEDDFLLKLKTALPKVDEDKYLSMVVDSITKHCPEFVDDFFYYPTIDFILRDLENNQALYELLKSKIKKEYPYSDWWIVADINKKTEAKIVSYDLYLHLIKRESRNPNETTLKLYQQDMGQGEVMNIALQERGYYEAYASIFTPSVADNDIDLLFEINGPTDFTLKNAYTTAISTARGKNANGMIQLNSTGDKIIIDGAIWIRDPAKSIDPLSVENPIYGNIFAFTKSLPDINVNKIGDLCNLYVGYPNTVPKIIGTVPIANPLVGQPSKNIFDSEVDRGVILLPGGGFAQYNQEIRDFLKELNQASVDGTVAVINELLSFWIENPSIVSYQLILENQEQTKKGDYRLAIIGYKFTSNINMLNSVEPFSFEVHIGDFTVSNICHTMMKCAANDPDPNSSQERIINQMNKIRAHPGYRYRPGLGQPINGLTIDYALTIIATIKSFGDEGQELSFEKIKIWLKNNPNLDPKSKNIFLLTSDRPLAGQTLFYNLSLICELLIPHISFGNQDEIKDKIPSMFNSVTSKEVNVHHVNGGLLSNRKSLLSTVKSTYQLLNETVTEYYVAYNLLRNKNAIFEENLPEIYPFNPAAALPLPDDEDDSMEHDLSNALPQPPIQPPRSLKNDYDDLQQIVAVLLMRFPTEDIYEASTPENKEKYKEDLKNYREKIGKIKNLLDCLEYYDENFENLTPREQTEKYMEYINKQIKHAISVSIPAPLFTQIKAFNGTVDEMGEVRGGGINNVKDITKALSNMYDNYDFYSKIFDLHDIACESFKEKIQKYINIINDSSLDGSIKELIIGHYTLLQEGITAINDKFTEDAKSKLTELITKRENPRYASRDRKGPPPSGSTTIKEELQTEQSILTKKRDECTELTKKIAKLEKDLINAQTTEKNLKTNLEAKKTEISNAEAKRKGLDKKNKPAIAAAKTKEDQLISEKQQLQADLAATKKFREDQEKQIKAQKSEKDKRNTFMADLLSKITKLENKLTLAVQNEMAKVHTKGTDTLKQISNWFSSKFAGGKNKKTRQNKQKHHKKYTKRNNKKIYRKRSQKHHKIKRHKYTKKR
jgi:hypothetical protein